MRNILKLAAAASLLVGSAAVAGYGNDTGTGEGPRQWCMRLGPPGNPANFGVGYFSLPCWSVGVD